MKAQTDRELLRAYASENSESAFAELVERHVPHIYSAALRIIVDRHLAEDVTQATFAALAQNARKLAGREVLSGWLHVTARNVAARIVRGEERRRSREKEAVAMQTGPSEENETWSRLAPHLDAALGQLNDNDRDALMLRFFERKTAEGIAQHLGLRAEAAQKRVTRGLDRLRGALVKRGVALSSGALAGVISLNAVQAVPASLAATTTCTALASAQATAGTAFTIFKIMAMTKVQCGIAGAILLAGVAVSFWHHEHKEAVRARNAFRQESAELEKLRAENQVLTEELKAEAVRPMVNGEVLRLRAQAAQLREAAQENTRLSSQLQQSAAASNGGASLEEILRVLHDQDTSKEADSRRYDAAAKLKSLGAKASEGLSQFLELLHSGNQESAYAGARALAFTSASSIEALQTLTNALSDPDAQVRDAASHGTSLLMNRESTNMNAATVLPLLVRNLQDPSQTVRSDTASTLVDYIQWQKSVGQGADSEVVVPALTRILTDQWSYARWNAARALGEYGEKARDAVPELQKLLVDADEQVRRFAAEALQRIAPKESNPGQ